MGRYRLPSSPSDGAAQRVKAFLAETWPGRILVGAVVLFVVEVAGIPLPGVVGVLDRLLLVVYGGWFLFRFGRFLLGKFLWRIRRKLILSYLFIAVVPVVLLVALFLLAGLLFSGLVGSYMVATELEQTAHQLQGAARGALVDLPVDGPDRRAALERRLAPARAVHQQLSYVLLRDGRVLESSGHLPKALPSWIEAPGFAGLVKGADGEHDAVRAAWIEGRMALVLDVPLDAQLLSDFEKRTGLRLLTIGGTVNATGGDFELRVDDSGASRLGQRSEVTGMAFLAAPERTSWETGKRDNAPLTFSYEPFGLVRRLSTGSLNMADLLVKAFTVLAVVFLFVYAFALLLGLLLARSITRSIHALSVGTERLRAGDLVHRIPVSSRDQLGELAESFNTMSQGISDLLRQQAEKERLEEELRIARSIQMSLLPAHGVTVPSLHVAALCLPAAEVGGDYYDLILLSETRMGVLVADVSGKGTSAALYMAELKGLVLSLSRMYASPARLLVEANSILAATMDSRSFVTMTYAVVDGDARTMRFARAGHNPIIHFDAASGATRVLAPQGLGLGIDRGEKFAALLEEAEVPLRSGDVFLFFTDGLSEAMNGRSELFGERRLRDILERSEALGSEDLKEAILSEIRAFVGDAAQHDDMTLVVLKVV